MNNDLLPSNCTMNNGYILEKNQNDCFPYQSSYKITESLLKFPAAILLHNKLEFFAALFEMFSRGKDMRCTGTPVF